MNFEKRQKEKLGKKIREMKDRVENNNYEKYQLINFLEECEMDLEGIYAFRKSMHQYPYEGSDGWNCPECGSLIFSFQDREEDSNPPDYCYNCGQRLDLEI